MKKILLAFDGSHYSEAALEFSRKLNEREPIMLTGAFLPQIYFSSLWSMVATDIPVPESFPLMDENTAEEVRKNVDRFESYCRKHQIRFSTHRQYYDFAVPELKTESRFADLLIVSSQEFYKQAGTDMSNVYLRELLHGLECPLIVIPEKDVFPSALILTYDGSASSMYAIRQFAYLFPEWTSLPATILHTTSGDKNDWPHEQQVRELIEAHFSKINWECLALTSQNMLSAWLSEHKNAVLVSGSFGRSDLSMLFRKSYITGAINEHELPVFIAHK